MQMEKKKDYDNFVDLLVEDENFENTDKISLKHNKYRHDADRILNELSLNGIKNENGDNDSNDDDNMNEGEFVRGSNVRSNRRKTKMLSKKYNESAGGYKLQMDHELDESEILTKRIIGLLNRITPEKFDKLASKMMSIIEELADSEEKFTKILDSILDKASTEPVFAEQYADLCLHLSNKLPSIIMKFQWKTSNNIITNDTKQISKIFRRMMIMSCEKRFSSQRDQVLEKLPADIDQESANDLQSRRKKKFFGTMVIVGELFNKKLVHENIIYKGIIKRLLPPENKSLQPTEIEALCKLLKTCGRSMDKDERSHKILTKYIDIMKKFSLKFEFRIQVIVDEIEEMKNNKWTLRIKKEKAKKLQEIHNEFHNKHNKKKHTHPHTHTHTHSHPHNNQQSRPRYNNNHHPKPPQFRVKIKSSPSPPKYVQNNVIKKNQNNNQNQTKNENENNMEKIMSIIRESLISGTCSDLIDFCRKHENNKCWGQILNSIFVNRTSSEVDIFISFLLDLFKNECVNNNNNEFVNNNFTFLAKQCDDSIQDCPLFTSYLGKCFAKLFDNKYIKISSLEYFCDTYYETDKNNSFATPKDIKIKRFTKILISILKCLITNNSKNILQQISKQTYIKNNIDINIFKKSNEDLKLLEYISK